MIRREAIGEIIEWVLTRGREDDDLGAILAGLATRLIECGLPICRLFLGMPTIDPTASVIQHVWWRDGDAATHKLPPNVALGSAYLQSPIRYLIERQQPGGRWKLDDPAVLRQFPVFEELRERGVTEYALSSVQFSEARTALAGAAMAIATDRRGGFTQDEIEAARQVLPALAIVAYRIVLLNVATQTLAAYLGPQTGGRVLRGMIRRGDSRIIAAALLLADLRGFTALVDSAPAEEVVAWLNEHFDVIGAAVVERGGEILKFLGDGLLAVFPVDGAEANLACGQAIEAALAARARNGELNTKREALGRPTLALNLVLHFGEVAYGNIGTARRLDFTVIGRAVNEASRMEALGKSLGRDLLLSESFTRHCDRATASLGEYELRGIAEKREIFVLAPTVTAVGPGKPEKV